MPAPEELQALIKNFENQIDDLKSKDYKELSLCTDYLNPFFKLLGWDVDNVAGKSEKFRDVTQQYRLTIGGSSKAPDYLFKIGNTGVFLVEAKKPAVDLDKAKDPAFQLRRYGWNMKEIDVSILSDFETLFVYDCRIKPSAEDEPFVGRVAKYTYKDYLTHWDEIESIFSRTNVEKGSLDKLLKEKNIKGVKESVDESFLKMIEEWRELLAKNIALRNENLGVRELNFAVQQTIDRIIFLRIAEDRGLEAPGQLLGYTNSANIYGNLIKLYENADSRYNSGLFHFKVEKDIDTPPDTISMSLSIDDKTLKDMITNLYYPKSPFDFSAMPADILGQVYERFLGKVIRLTSGHQAKVEEKPEVRKAGGVYYTPTYIVDYIVQNTVGKLVENKTPDQVAKLRILDPACGSGSFLIGAYQFLLDWHLDWYQVNDRDKWLKGKNAPICEQMSEGQRIFRLTTEKRKEILKNNIYGVDIDRQAVEVSKLNLLLKVLEQENNPDLFKHNQRALPDLGANIKCGNSLIGMDFYNGKEDLFKNPEETWRINAMDWDVAFPSIIRFRNASLDKGGARRAEGSARELEDGFGFDAVIGNPPYISLEINEIERCFYNINYLCLGKINTYRLFLEKGLLLIRHCGILGFIIPNTYLTDRDSQQIRRFIIENYNIKQILYLPEKLNIFNGVTQATTIITIQNNKHIDNEINVCHPVVKIPNLDDNSFHVLKQDNILNYPETMIITRISENHINLVIKMILNNASVSKIADVYQGEVNVSIYKANISTHKINDNYKPLIRGNNISRYYYDNRFQDPKGSWINSDYISRKHQLFRIVTQEVSNMAQIRRLNATPISENIYVGHTANYLLVNDPKHKHQYILGLLNSKLLDFVFQAFNSTNHIPARELLRLPIRTIDFANKSDVEKHDKIVALVETMLDLNKRLHECSVPSDTEMIKRQIEHTDRQIDQLVYELYGLTDDEIRIVEDSFADSRKKQ